jgi:hypothetical protein
VQVGQLEEAQVGGNLVPGFEDHDIAGHQGAGRHAFAFSIALHEAFLHHHVAQRVQGPLGLAFLYEAEHGVQEHHGEDHDRVRQHVAAEGRENSGHARGHEQDDDHRIVELAQEPQPCRRLLERDLVEAAGFQASRRLGLAETRFGAVQAIEDG